MVAQNKTNLDTHMNGDDKSRSFSWIRLLIAIVICMGLLIVGAIQFMKSDTISKPNDAFLTMTQKLFPIQEAATICWKDQKVLGRNCASLKNGISYLNSDQKAYFISEYGALIGIDYESHVVVIISPIVEDRNLKWHCAGSPLEAAQKSCAVLQ